MNSRVLKGSLAAVAAAAIALGAAGCSGKPGKEAVIDGWLKGAKQAGEVTEEQEAANKPFVTCLINESYDKVSADTLKKIADGEISSETLDGISEEDNKVFEEALSVCSVRTNETEK